MADVLTIIAEAGAAGIAFGQLQKKSKLKQAALDEEIKQLRAEHQIAGPFKYKRSDYYYARGYEPGGETASRLIEVQIRKGGGKLLTKSNVEKAVKLPFKTFFNDGVRILVGTGRAVELKAGQVHIFSMLMPHSLSFPTSEPWLIPRANSLHRRSRSRCCTLIVF